MSKKVLLEKLTDRDYREAFISEEIDVGLPMQLRAMREARGWNQKNVAEQMDTKQPRFSLMEKPGYGNFSLNTLKRLASIFNVGLIVSFVPFSEMIDFRESFSNKRLTVPSFADEYSKLAIRYSKGDEETRNTGQENLELFGASTASTLASPAILNRPGTGIGTGERPAASETFSSQSTPRIFLNENGARTHA